MTTQGQVVDVRDVIAERLEKLLGPVRALERAAQRNANIPARNEVLAFCASVEAMVTRYTAFCEADQHEMEGELIRAVNANTAGGLEPTH